MSDEHEHEPISIDKEKGEDYFDEVNAQEDYLQEVLRSISPDGRTFTPLELRARELIDADGNPVVNLPEPANSSDAARLLEVDEVSSDVDELNSIKADQSDLNNLANTVDDKADREGDALEPDTLRIIGDDAITVDVPSDYDTLEEAIETIATYQVPSDTEVEINIESGHTVSEEIFLESATLGHVWITSEDSTVDVDVDGHLFEAWYSTLPILDCLFDMDNNGENGYFLRGCLAYTTTGSGVLNAGYRGFECRDTVFDLSDTDFSGAGNRCYNITRASCGSVTGSTGNDAGEHGLFVSRAARVNAIEGEFNNNGSDGVKVQRGWVALNTSDASYNGGSGMWCQASSVVDCRNSTFIENDERGIRGTDGPNTIAADRVEVTDSGQANIDAGNGTQISATESVLDGSGWPAAVRSRGGMSSVTITDAEISNYDDYAIECEEGSFVAAHGVDVDGSSISTSDVNLSDFNSIESGGIIFN